METLGGVKWVQAPSRKAAEGMNALVSECRSNLSSYVSEYRLYEEEDQMESYRKLVKSVEKLDPKYLRTIKVGE